MQIAIMGSGGMGGYFGGMLARAGEDVHFIARGSHLEAMQSTEARFAPLRSDSRSRGGGQSGGR